MAVSKKNKKEIKARILLAVRCPDPLGSQGAACYGPPMPMPSYPRLVECLSFAAQRADTARAPMLQAVGRYWLDLHRDLAACLGRDPWAVDDEQEEDACGGATVVDQAQGGGIARCLGCGRDEDQCGQLLPCDPSTATEIEPEDADTGDIAQLCSVCASFAQDVLTDPQRDLDRPLGHLLAQTLCGSLEGEADLGPDGPAAARLIQYASESFGYFVPLPRQGGICTSHGSEIPGWQVVGRLGALCTACAQAAGAAHDGLRVDL